jgi:hypothetical protein
MAEFCMYFPTLRREQAINPEAKATGGHTAAVQNAPTKHPADAMFAIELVKKSGFATGFGVAIPSIIPHPPSKK